MIQKHKVVMKHLITKVGYLIKMNRDKINIMN